MSLIDDLMELARGKMGRLEIELEPADVRDAANEVIDAYAPAAEEKDLRLTTDFPKTLPTISSDPGRVRQILGNLIPNAVKYTPESGSVEVVIRERAGRRDGGHGSNFTLWLPARPADNADSTGIPESG